MTEKRSNKPASTKSHTALAPNGLLSTMLISLILALIFVFQSYHELGNAALSAVTALTIGALGLAIAFIWRRIENTGHRRLVYTIYMLCCWPALLLLSGLVLFPVPMSSTLELIAINLPLFAAAVTLLTWVLNHKKDNSVLLPASLGLVLFLGLMTNTWLDFNSRFLADSNAGGRTIRADELQPIVTAEPSEDRHTSDEALVKKEVTQTEPIGDDLESSEASSLEQPTPLHDRTGGEDDAEVTLTKMAAKPRKADPQPSVSAVQDRTRSDPSSSDPVVSKSKASRKRMAQKIAQSERHPVWSYDNPSNGPKSWHRLDRSYRVCQSGKEQSPINIPASWELQKDILSFYATAGFGVIDNGHSIEMRPRQVQHVFINGQRYDLVNLHFHNPSEHYLAGAFYPMEMHLVHRSQSGQVAVIAVFVDVGAHHPEIAKIQDYMPESVGNAVEPRDLELDFKALLPEFLEAYRYYGSLTTPPCTENVLWSVLRTPIKISNQQLEIFRAKYQRNNRPLQPLHYR